MEICPHKKARRAKSKGGNGIKLLYFDLIPQNALENIVRLPSTSPRDENWYWYLDADQIISLFRINGDFGLFMKTFCENLSLTYGRFTPYYKERTFSVWKECNDWFL